MSKLLATTLSLLAAGGVLTGLAVALKPSEESFDKYFNQTLKNRLTEENSLPVFVNKFYAKGIKASSRTYFRNYKVCRVAVVTLPDSTEELYFLGAFKGWIHLPSLDMLEDLGLIEE